MTVSSNFNSLNEAKDAQRKMITTTNTPSTTIPPLSSISFWCQEIYLLERLGDNGQFMKRMTIPLGCRNKKDDDDQKISGSVTNTVNDDVNENLYVNDDDIDDNDDDDIDVKNNLDDSSSIMQYQYHDPLLRFIDMPVIEEDWIYKERMGLKRKRKFNNKNKMRDDNDDDDDGSESVPTKIIRRRRKKLSKSNTRSKRIRRSERNKKMKSKMIIIPPTNQRRN